MKKKCDRNTLIKAKLAMRKSNVSTLSRKTNNEVVDGIEITFVREYLLITNKETGTSCILLITYSIPPTAILMSLTPINKLSAAFSYMHYCELKKELKKEPDFFYFSKIADREEWINLGYYLIDSNINVIKNVNISKAILESFLNEKIHALKITDLERIINKW